MSNRQGNLEEATTKIINCLIDKNKDPLGLTSITMMMMKMKKGMKSKNP